MNTIIDINLKELAIGAFLLVIPIVFFYIYRIKLVKDVLINVIRMVVQLGLVALYLEFIFELNNAWINSIWVLVMIVVGVLTAINRIGLKTKYFVLPFFIAGLTSILIIDTFCLGFILKLDYVFDARYFIPITGMILGNALNHNIVGLNTYFRAHTEKRELYRFLLSNTGNQQLAVRPFIEEAAKTALNPMIANMSVVGLVTLPGMMTGQILGGSQPAVAIKYQIMIMIAIFVGCTINIFLSIIFTNKIIFNEYGNMKDGLVKENGLRLKKPSKHRLKH
ncbi:ABC transporter permease [Draconibacterium sp. IB214405]|uniref:ABC transporter permease n=1 Tax=Draconibacterium sp. IB214405 TaxID=3097352 RepID=UPI002A0DF927|nr:ABC transporter permease [Draconibacterium sp. IB214405]MDX8339450.1 ABC transporter permease [Draconibacterium sp. IB214405]